jgi:hypothetical protein
LHNHLAGCCRRQSGDFGNSLRSTLTGLGPAHLIPWPDNENHRTHRVLPEPAISSAAGTSQGKCLDLFILYISQWCCEIGIVDF